MLTKKRPKYILSAPLLKPLIGCTTERGDVRRGLTLALFKFRILSIKKEIDN